MYPPLARAALRRRSGAAACLAVSVALTAAWALIGTLACVATYQMSLHPENPADAAPFPGTLWLPVLALAGGAALLLTPWPIVGLVTGLVYLRRVALRGWWWQGAWAGAACLTIAVQALYVRGIVISPGLRHPNWGPTLLAAAFAAAGAVMNGTLVSAAFAAGDAALGWRRRLAMPIRVVLERGPKARKFVAFAVDWPGWSRGAKTAEAALDTLAAYRDRYQPVASLAGLGQALAAAGPLDVAEDRAGTGSTDFWGISFSPSSFEQEPMDAAELERKITLLQACWTYFDDVAARVSPQLRKGPRGGGRDRDTIIRHTVRTESEDFAKKVGLVVPERGALEPGALAPYRSAYTEAMRAYQRGEVKRPMRSWTLAFLVRHSAFHTMDHAWEMEDKDLSGEPASGSPA